MVASHESGDTFAACHYACISVFSADAWHAVGFFAGNMRLTNALEQLHIGLVARAGCTAKPVVIAASAHLQCFTLAAHGQFGLVCFHEFVDGVNVFSLLPANQAVAFANMSRSI